MSISFEKGEVHALIGENGAGKSTFIKTLSGAIRPTSGTIEFEGKTYDHLEPRQAIDLGIAVVYQELIQFEAMSVADNIFMGVEDASSGLVLNDRQRCEKTKDLLKAFDCDIDPRTLIRELSIANRQIIELTKAMVRNAKVVVMDEPTAAITLAEQEKLYKLVKQLKNQGVTVIYISHRLEELFEICDRVSVLRDGQYVTTCDMKDITKQDMIKLMVGRVLTNAYPGKKPASDEVVLEVENLTGNGVKDISFQLHKGEILGFAGLVGSGRTELMHLIYGAAKRDSGTIRFRGKEVNFHSPADGLKAGIGLIPEDRKFQGCFIDKPIYWNNSISALDSISRRGIVDRTAEMKMAEDYKARLKTKAPFLHMVTGGLSGGNQQKVVIAKALAALPEILIFDEPTRGIDIGARYEIYLLMNELAEQGKSILMVSSDMEELLGMSERIIVLHEGRQAGELKKEEFSQERVLTCAFGV
ncbi:MAG: sugar ABC transporter ATP-binding protein [Faecousia sp.]